MGNKFKVLVCRGPSCGDKRGSSQLRDEFDRLLTLGNIEIVEMMWQSCFGRCTKGPNVLVRELPTSSEPDISIAQTFVLATAPPARGGRATMYNHVALSDIAEIVQEHIVKRKPVWRLAENSKQHKERQMQAQTKNTELDGDS